MRAYERNKLLKEILIVVVIAGVFACVSGYRIGWAYGYQAGGIDTNDTCVIPTDMRVDYESAYKDGFNACLEQF